MEVEWAKLERQEDRFLAKGLQKKETQLSQLLEHKVPEKLKKSLDLAFSKAFGLIFEKGVGLIEKTYRKEELKKAYQINEFTAQVRQDAKSLKAFRKQAGGSGNQNLFLSGVSGIGLGALGIGLPDIPVFTAIMLKSIYEIALHYGFSYEEEIEQQFILRLIRGAVSHGDELLNVDQELNCFIEKGTYGVVRSLEEEISLAAAGISGELLYMKFLQGVPIVGAIGGAYDAIYMKQITAYAELKYRRRFYTQMQKWYERS